MDENYSNLAMDSLGENPVFLIDDSDIIKLLGEKSEDLGIVRAGLSRNKSYEKGVFVNDRDYDNNLIFNHYFYKKQYFVIRLKENIKIYCNHKWYKITTIRDSHKGKIK